MEVFSFRFTAYGLLLVCSLLSVTNCSTTASGQTTEVTTGTEQTTGTTTVTTQPATTPELPEDVENVTVVGQTETSVTIEFYQVPNITLYKVNYIGGEENCPVNGDPVNCTVDDLMPAKIYNMTIHSVSDSSESEGYLFNATTAPENVDNFTAVDQNETSITLNWTTASVISQYTLKFEEREETFTVDDPVRYVVLNLNSTTQYNFTLYTVFEDITSTGANLTAATAPPNAKGFGRKNQTEISITLQWNSVPDVTDYVLESVHNETKVTGNEVTITNLTSGTLHSFTLFAVFKNVRSSGFTITAATVPRDATVFTNITQTDTTITLQWDRVGDIQTYELTINGAMPVPVSVSASEDIVNYTVPNLESGTLNNFTLNTVIHNLTSSGISHQAATVPPQVSSVKVVDRTLTTITLQWDSVRDDWEYVLEISDTFKTVFPNEGSVSHIVENLTPGTVYPFNIITVFRSLKSEPFQDRTATGIDCTKVDWHVTETTIQGTVVGAFTSATASNGTQHENSGSNPEIRFTDLYPGANYSMTLMYEDLLQCTHDFIMVPPSLTAKCKDWNGGYSIYIEWDHPSGVWDKVDVSVSGQEYEVKHEEFHTVIPNFQPAKKYQVSVSTRSGSQRSRPYEFICATDARGVIAGAFFGVLLFVILVCAVLFVMLRRPDIIRRKKSVMGGARSSVKKSKRIPLEKFPAHFNEQSADENKGFSLDYEDLGLVGTDQTQKAATVQENKPKNRFVNVLPYDRSRVKLTSSTPHNDYINASYMPGYNSDREFIAAQGPMPSTVNDFWRMIWEQKVSGIVMVTNCTEGGRTKCEQYWPDSNPRVCGELTVSTTSEQKEMDWTLREFAVKHRRTSEERTVKHFHFTAWPDHGVPQGTDVLIQFRALVRKHIQVEASGAPTVVHCSAGVGRTGTIIALDTLLQQLEKEKAVDIYGFVHKMRLNRPHMVQTESQYVFLHQCILDILQLNDKHEENIYENELIYANATALREYQNNMNKA